MHRSAFLAGVACLVAVVGVAVAQRAPVAARVESNQEETAGALHTLEGRLRVHPKFHYRYSIHGFGDGQSCALFGADPRLASLEPGTPLRVRGRLASKYFGGDPASRPIALVSTWVIYMDVEDVEVLTPGQ